MKYLLVLLLLLVLLVLVLKLISMLMAEIVSLNREELSPYECGFEHHNMSRVPFSLRYFFLTLIFLLFDLEIVLLLYTPVIFLTNFFLISFLVFIVVVWVLYLSLIYEWNDGTLEWLS